MTLEGPVEARNSTGIKLGGEWRNLSKFRPLALPDVGARVRAEVDDKGFLRSLEPLDTPAPAAAGTAPSWTSARLAVLQAAAQFAAYRPTIKPTDVPLIADCWLQWLLAEGNAR